MFHAGFHSLPRSHCPDVARHSHDGWRHRNVTMSETEFLAERFEANRSNLRSVVAYRIWATHSRPPGVSSIAFGAQPPDLSFASLMDMDFATSCPLVRRWRLISGFCSSACTFAPRFLQTPPHGGSPCVSLTLHLHQVG
jgi:hypothetical protein